MRGKVVGSEELPGVVGITPACAGKSGFCQVRKTEKRDHPRVCGEKRPMRSRASYRPGSPPRMRGKGLVAGLPVWRCRITPAYAGKRATVSGVSCPSLDHPRVCGEKPLVGYKAVGLWGSPPRVRGKGSVLYIAALGIGITPAYAGKSPSAWGWSAAWWDHPRVCGEKLVHRPGRRLRLGITPAYAGKSACYCRT